MAFDEQEANIRDIQRYLFSDIWFKANLRSKSNWKLDETGSILKSWLDFSSFYYFFFRFEEVPQENDPYKLIAYRQILEYWYCICLYTVMSILTTKVLFKPSITKTCLYNFDPLKAHFYIIKKWGLEGYILFFLFLLKNIACGYSLEPPRWGGSDEYPQSMFRAETWKISNFYLKILQFFGGEIFSIFE